ncbi:Heterokaryon incompatibility [Akanthomyces lecanii RCEF 1005]|uniref:Heterokaryon incompatibility n=1 Tax=Akanthomyces lecanii RCEF 1005 TaxID=1081108 RepID=A0A167WSN3_CORDF|nr:Heterokaryon incompatibility [Akanthomyces lecanii RCEF 1005]
MHHYFRRRDCPDDVATAEAARVVRYHATIDSLREAAVAECDLCTLVLGEAEALLAELNSLEESGLTTPRYSPPTFDMWVTQRPDGGQGLWVISEPSVDRRSGTIMPIAAFAFVVEEDDPFAEFIPGRPVKTTIDSSVLKRVRRCVTQCDQEHDGCGARPVGPAPKRLLDLHSSTTENHNTIRLVELGNDSREKYAALSYASESYISRLESDELVDGANIPVDSLPKTFQDAILATRILGLQYLWIDSLCIPGSVTGWQRSSAQAGAIYTNAYLTISATGANNALDGLFFPRVKPKYARVPYRASDGTAGSVLVSSLPLVKEVICTRYMEMKDEPISVGVWSFQERVLSQRVVHFASDQIYIECAQEFVSEDGLRERLRYHNTTEILPVGTKDYGPVATTRSPISRWFALLWDYGRRVPENPADKLTALSNIARAFKPMSDGAVGEYVAGHWTNSLVESLCWQSLKSKPAGDSAAPSWSWASVNGIVGMGFGSGVAHHCLATVDDTDVTLADDGNPFGRVIAGAITLQAPPLIPVLLLQDEELGLGSYVSRRVRVRSQDGSEDGVIVGIDTKDKRHVRPCDVLEGRKLFALVLAETHGYQECTRESHDPEGTLHGLLVTPATSSGGDKVRRLGFLVAGAADLGPASLFSTRESVTLV